MGLEVLVPAVYNDSHQSQLLSERPAPAILLDLIKFILIENEKVFATTHMS